MKIAKNKHRANSFLYAFYALANFIVICTVFSVLGWHGFEQLIKDLKLIKSTITPIGVLTLVNIAMAFLCWNFTAHSKTKKIIIISIAVLLLSIPAYGLIVSLAKAGTVIPKLFSLGFVVMYGIPAYNLIKSMLSNKTIKRMENVCS